MDRFATFPALCLVFEVLFLFGFEVFLFSIVLYLVCNSVVGSMQRQAESRKN